jgi:DNA-binding NarL/FixJ family response regulator
METGGTLIVSNAKDLLPFYKRFLEKWGFKNVSFTSQGKDGLNFLINELKPRLMLIESGFYGSATPYMMGLLLRSFPKLNIAAVSTGEFPDDLAMWFIFHGVKSYLNLWEGTCSFRHGLMKIRKGETYISHKVRERIELRNEIPTPALDITERQKEVMLLLCNGYTTKEIEDTLHICQRTVESHKHDLYLIYHLRNDRELLRVAYCLDFISKDDFCFYGRNWEVAPLPEGEYVEL